MKRISFGIGRDCKVIGIVAKRTDNWSKLIPTDLHYCLKELDEKTNGDLTIYHGFYIGDWPLYVIVIFDEPENDFFSTLSHESGHVQRHMVWAIGDKMVRAGDESYARLQTDIYEAFKERMIKNYGMVSTVTWKPNARQKKREIK